MKVLTLEVIMCACVNDSKSFVVRKVCSRPNRTLYGLYNLTSSLEAAWLFEVISFVFPKKKIHKNQH